MVDVNNVDDVTIDINTVDDAEGPKRPSGKPKLDPATVPSENGDDEKLQDLAKEAGGEGAGAWEWKKPF